MHQIVPHVARPSTAWEHSDSKLLDATAQGCLTVDSDLVIVFANRAICTMLDCREHELIGSHLFNFVDQSGRHILERQVAMRDLVQHRSYDMTLIRSDGTPVYVIFSAGRLEDAAGRTTGSCILVTDVTHRRQHEMLLELQREQLSETLERMNRFLSLVTHEIKDPLSGVLAFADTLLEHGSPSTDLNIRDFAELCRNAGRQIVRMLDNLSLWSNIQLDSVTADLTALDLAGLITDLLEHEDITAAAKDITLVRDLQPARVMVDHRFTSVILHNLIDNAIKYSHPGAKVWIAMTAANGRVQVRISDAGVGIGPIKLNNLFRIDHHHATAGTRGETGSGLGLILSKALAERQGGDIRIESTPGHGTSAILNVPAAGICLKPLGGSAA